MNPKDDSSSVDRERTLIHAALDDASRIAAEGSDLLEFGAERGRAEWPAADSLPNYRIVEEIHRGGQGVVYKAVQERTGRTVAIKVLRKGSLTSERAGLRFDREIKVLGRLEHPNIVAIHDSGETPTCSYFVMDYIAGQPLDVFAAQRELPIRDVLTLCAKTCRAVNAAHLLGVIHRDLKPGNVLVDDHAEPHILDFGLAKLTGAATVAGSEPGQFVGSLPWASPEQIAGDPDAVDLRTDVYSLGVILYQLLTGRLPFASAGSTNEMLAAILHTEPPRLSLAPRHLWHVWHRRPAGEPESLWHRRPAGEPESPRPRRPLFVPSWLRASVPSSAIDSEVDTIVLKSLSKDPRQRYQTAGELGRDLERYLAGEPIEAKRDSPAYVLRKQLSKHKLSVAVAAAFLIVVFVGLAASLTFWRQAETQRAVAERQRQRAEANLGLALEALDKIYLKVAERLPGKKAPISDADRELLQNALTFYERFAQENSGAVQARHETARAYIRAGDIHERLGRVEQALQAVRQGLNLFQALSVDFPDQPLHRYDVAWAHRRIADALGEAGRVNEALEAFEQSLAIQRTLGEQIPNEPKYRAELASTLDGMAVALIRTGRFDEAEQFLQQALTIENDLAAEFPDNADYQVNRAESLHRVGYLLLQRGRYAEAEPHVRQVLDIRRRLMADFPQKVKVHDRYDLSMSYNNLGLILWRTEKHEESEQNYREALRMREQLAAEFPHVPEYRAYVGSSLTNLGILLKAMGRLQHAEQAYRRALEIHEGLVEEFPDLPDYQNRLGATLHNLASVLEARGQFAEAVALYERAIDHQQTALKANARNPTYRQFLSNHYARLVWLLATCPDPALRDAPRTVQLAKSALALFPNDADVWNSLGVAYYRTADWRAAIEAQEKSMELKPSIGSYSYFFLAMAHWQLDDHVQARQWYDRAVAWMQENEPDNKELQRFCAEAAELLGLEPEAGADGKEAPPDPE